MVTSAQRFNWDETEWQWDKGFGRQENPEFNVSRFVAYTSYHSVSEERNHCQIIT